MIIAVPKSTKKNEKRVALTPEVALKLIKQGFEIRLEIGSGKEAGFTDKEYEDTGVKVLKEPSEVYKNAKIVLNLWAPTVEEEKYITPEMIVIAYMEALKYEKRISELSKTKCKLVALELIPRISRAQSMDILSSQSNLAGYKAVIDAVSQMNKAVPLMMTSAGTIAPAKVLIVGVGVAGLQAIATAQRLGAVVFASDIRPETKEQVESLNGKFLTSEEMKQQLSNMDIIITAAMVLGNKPPKLITKAMEDSLNKNVIIYDLADNVEELSKIKVIKNTNLASELAFSASKLYANNLYNFINLIYDKELKDIRLDMNDEIIKACVIGE